MGSLGEVAATSVRGGFTLFVGNAMSLVVSAAGSILVARLLSPSEYGLFSVSLVLPGLFGLFSDWGVNSALTRFIARYRSEDRPGGIRVLERAGFLFKLAVGGILSLALFLSADVLAAVLLRRPEAVGLVRVTSLLVLCQSMHSTATSVLAGLERMDYRAAVSVVQAVVKGVCSPFLVYFGFGVFGAIIGHVLSYIVAASIGLVFAISSSLRLEKRDIVSWSFTDSLRLMLGFGIPLFVGILVSGFAGSFRGVLMSRFVSDEVIGSYGVATRFISLISLVTGSIGVTLFPAFSRFRHEVAPDKTREAFQGSVRYSSMFVLPLICLLAAASKPAVYTLFTSKYPEAPQFLVLLLVPTLLVGMGSLSFGSFLNSQGDTGTTMKISLITSVVSILLSPVLLWIWGVYGLIVSVILSVFAGNLLGLLVLHGKYGVLPDLRHTWRTFLCSMASAGLAHVVLWRFSTLTPFLGLFSGTVVFLTVYLVLAPLIGALEERDVENLDSMLRGLSILYPFARLLLNVEDKILRLKMKMST